MENGSRAMIVTVDLMASIDDIYSIATAIESDPERVLTFQKEALVPS